MSEQPVSGLMPFAGLRRRLRDNGFLKSLRTPLGIIGVIFVAFWILMAIFGPLVEPYDPLAQEFDRLQAPNATNWFGTDQVGRDVFSRVIASARVTIPISVFIVVVSVCVGSFIGALAGYLGKVFDEIIMRLTDIMFAFPSIILAMIISATLGPGLKNAVIALLVVSWPSYARIVRSMVLTLKSSEFVIAGRLIGRGVLSSLIVDVLPNVLTSMLVLLFTDFGGAVLMLSNLSFLGLGVLPPDPDWGTMVQNGMGNFSAWWVALFPGLAILTLVISVNFIGDALQDSLDLQNVTSHA
ncbi:ABC transporter permease [Bifidobacterium sp. 82T10]|uniref:ABC transporter permease n=1 Tax=Bifidobacterium miconis TaxID=2834435 RepID=A0ABS6WFR7_9BIFI|nr:ABC transporter permease [Bifidobacterium miconis]MBW3092061.1 ABC transporter permease [Bifidobacterium miconis]